MFFVSPLFRQIKLELEQFQTWKESSFFKREQKTQRTVFLNSTKKIEAEIRSLYHHLINGDHWDQQQSFCMGIISRNSNYRISIRRQTASFTLTSCIKELWNNEDQKKVRLRRHFGVEN